MFTALTTPALPMATDPSSPSMNVSTMAWVTTIGVIFALLVLDLATSGRKPHEVTFREASLWSIFYTVVGVAFGIWVWKASGAEFGKEYFAAYVVERSLSVDNLFVFAIILAQFAVPVYAPHEERIATATRRLREGDRITVEGIGIEFSVLGQANGWRGQPGTWRRRAGRSGPPGACRPCARSATRRCAPRRRS